jgi:hypothetical protein
VKPPYNPLTLIRNIGALPPGGFYGLSYLEGLVCGHRGDKVGRRQKLVVIHHERRQSALVTHRCIKIIALPNVTTAKNCVNYFRPQNLEVYNSYINFVLL